MSEVDKLHTGELYYPGDQSITKLQETNKDKLYAFNHSKPSEKEKKKELLEELLASVGEDSHIESPFNANWSGANLHLGKNVYINFNLTIVDDTYIYIDDNVMIGPNVVIVTGTHPVDPELRRQGLQYNKPVHIKDNVWIGSSVQIMPGVTIGENSIIGAGSIVTKDIPANVVAVGNPCRMVRSIG